MSELMPYLIFGLTAGSIYGLAAMGLVLTYKTSGVFNLAHGAVGAAGAYAFYSVRDQLGQPWPVAAAVAVLLVGGVSGLVLERLAAALSEVSTAYRIVATVGLLLAVRAVLLLLYGETARPFSAFLPQSTVATVAGVRISVESVVVLLLGTTSAVLLFLLFRRSRAGLAMRGVVDNADLLDMTGESPRAVRRNAWLIGSCFAAASGVLFAANQQQLDATLLSLLVVQAFGAAALGAFTSLPLSFLGGLAVGIVQKIVSMLAARHAELAGLDLNVPFLVLFAVLLLSPRRRLVEVGRQVKARVTTAPVLDPRLRAGLLALGLAVALLLPFLVGSRLALWNAALSQVLLFLSLGLLVRTSGQISLGHIGFAAVGASAFAHSQSAGAPWVVAVLLAGLAAVPVGAL
ncbi:MAG: branched-chain amino acid ABC transporter permease/ATP-binding protein, partial [Mycobacteriales bacterium]